MAHRLSHNVLIALVATSFGLGSAWLATRYLEDRVADIERRNAQVMARAVVAKTDLPAGTLITHEHAALREMPEHWLHSGAITPGQFERAVGAVLSHPAQAGEPLMWSQLEGRRSTRLSARLSPGRRAATVAVDEISTLSGMLAPGDDIDLLITVQQDRHSLTTPVLQGVRVIATGHRTAPGTHTPHDTQAVDTPVYAPALHDSLTQGDARTERDFTTITLDLSEAQAARLVAVRGVGKLTALLRASGDRSPGTVHTQEALALLGLSPPQPRAPVIPAVPVIYGGSGNALLEATPLHLPSLSAASP